MNQKLIQQIGRSQRLEIINSLKRTQGMSVKELAEKLKMSYMGVKAHCIQLQKQNYLDTVRRHKSMGRPELMYRLTKQTLDLFPRTSNPLTLDLLESATQVYGANASEKLLLAVFQQMTERLSKKIKGATASAKAVSLVRLRDAEGYMSVLEHSSDGSFKITEHNHLMFDLLDKYPIIARLEEEMFTNLLGEPVKREVAMASGQYRCEYIVAPSATNQAGSEATPEAEPEA